MTEKLQFKPLTIDGAGYRSWASNAEGYLHIQELEDTISEPIANPIQANASEAVSLRRMIKFISTSTGRTQETVNRPTILYEDNAACISHMERGYIKGPNTKHIDPKFFYAHHLNHKEIIVTKIDSNDNLADIFTKSLKPQSHKHLVPLLGLRSLASLQKGSSVQGEQ